LLISARYSPLDEIDKIENIFTNNPDELLSKKTIKGYLISFKEFNREMNELKKKFMDCYVMKE